MKESILQQKRSTMRNQCVTFHFAESNATTSFSSLNRLMGEHINGARRTHLPLIGHHVPQPLIVNDTQKNVGRHFATVNATVQFLGTIIIVTAVLQKTTEIIDGRMFFAESEWGGVVDEPMHRSRFAGHCFDHHGNGHARRETVRIENDVRY